MNKILIDQPFEDDHAADFAEYRDERRPRRRLRTLLWSVLGLLVALLLIQGGRIAWNLQRAYGQAQTFVDLARGELTAENYPVALASLQESIAALQRAETIFQGFSPLLHGLRWLPGIGADVDALPTLADAG
ncbi:MAG: hypothetical protein R2867_47900, partial [Caldilineaceae bacterium]